MTPSELTEVLQSVLEQQSAGWGLAELVAIVSAVAAIASALIAKLALNHSKVSAVAAHDAVQQAKAANSLALSANDITERIAKRSGVIELHQAWQGVSRIRCEKPVFVDAIRAANALDLTASLWNHDVLEREILFQSYWKSYHDLYRALSTCETMIPDDGRRLCDLISPAVTRAHNEMQEMETDRIPQTRIKK